MGIWIFMTIQRRNFNLMNLFFTKWLISYNIKKLKLKGMMSLAFVFFMLAFSTHFNQNENLKEGQISEKFNISINNCLLFAMDYFFLQITVKYSALISANYIHIIQFNNFTFWAHPLWNKWLLGGIFLSYWCS